MGCLSSPSSPGLPPDTVESVVVRGYAGTVLGILGDLYSRSCRLTAELLDGPPNDHLIDALVDLGRDAARGGARINRLCRKARKVVQP